MIAIIDYDAGNLTSVARAVNHIGYECTVTKEKQIIESADRVIFPGVGAAGSAMESLRRLGLDEVISRVYRSGKPLLGICLGTQVIVSASEEDGGTECLGLIEGKTRAFAHKLKDNAGNGLKIPHMGWNRVRVEKAHPVLKGIGERDEFYFVHGYYPDPADAENVLGRTEYGITFTSILGKDNLIATQFHPEKSGTSGLNLLKNFCEWKPC